MSLQQGLTEAWKKSSYSAVNGDCVEVAASASAHEAVAVRDSKDPQSPVLTFTPQSWSAFLGNIRQDPHAGI